MGEQRGPGETRWIANEDGSISVCRHNDPAWTTHVLSGQDPIRPEKVARLLREAYLEGMKDRAEMVRRAIGANP